MEETESTWPDFVVEGAYVRATAKDGSLTIEFRVARVDSDNELIIRRPDGGTGLVGIYPATYVVEQIKQPLPRAKGIYVDNEGDYWVIDEVGDPLRYVGAFDGVNDDYDPNDFTFTRLVPEGASA